MNRVRNFVDGRMASKTSFSVVMHIHVFRVRDTKREQSEMKYRKGGGGMLDTGALEAEALVFTGG